MIEPTQTTEGTTVEHSEQMAMTEQSAAAPHPSVFIQEEMAARGWDRWELARRMPGDHQMNRLELDLYFAVGPNKTNLRLGETGEDIARAFDVNPEFLHNMETAWLQAMGCGSK